MGFGPEQARESERDWLDEADSMDAPPLSTVRNWRAVSIAAAYRLAADARAMAHLRSDNDQQQRHFSIRGKALANSPSLMYETRIDYR